MRVFIIVLFLIIVLAFQSWTKADDIRDFEIEGMSIGDSLLDYQSKQEIEKLNKFDYSGKYKGIVLKDKNFTKYDDIQISYKNDNKYIIHSLGGRIHFHNKKFSECLSLRKTIEREFSKTFNNAKIIRGEKRKHEYDKSGKSFTYGTWYNLKDGSSANVICFDWSKKLEKEISDKLMISLLSKKFNNYLNTEAYK